MPNEIDPSQVQWDAPIDQSKVQWDDDKYRLGPTASKIVRPIAETLLAGPALLGDATVTAAKGIQEGADWVGKSLGVAPDPNATINKVQLPSKTVSDLLKKYTTAPKTGFEKASEFAESLMVPTGGAEELLSVGSKAAVAAAKKISRITSQAAKDGMAAGYKFSPAYVGGQVAKDFASVSGGPKLHEQVSSHNVEVTDRLAKTELDLHPNEELDENTFDQLREEAYKPYEQVPALGPVKADDTFRKDIDAAGGRFVTGTNSFKAQRNELIDDEKNRFRQSQFNSADALEEIKILRAKAARNLRAYDPAANAMGYVQRDIAKALEDQLDRQASKTNNPGLIEQLRASRKRLAQIEAVSDSVGAGGHVRAGDLLKLYKSGKPLTGNLQTIAVTAKNFPKDVQDMAKKGESGDFSAVDFMLGGTGLALHHPAIMGPSVARFGIRKALQSNPIQRRMIQGPGKAEKAVTKTLRKAAPIVTNELIGAYSPDASGDYTP